MANTTNYYFNLPVIGGSQNSWGSDLNENWSKLDSLLFGASYTDSDTNTVEKIRPDLEQNNWTINGAAVTATAAELNKLDGYTGNTTDLNILSGAAAAGVTATELQYISGVTSDIQSQIDSKGSASSPTFSGTVTIETADITTLNVGDWKIYVSGTDLKFQYNSVDVLKLTTDGALTVEDDITAFGSA